MAEDDPTLSAGERDRAKDVIADDDLPPFTQEELLVELRRRTRRPMLAVAAPGVGVGFGLMLYLAAPELGEAGTRDATSLFAQIAAAVVIVFSLEGRRAPRRDAMTFGLSYAYMALFCLMMAMMLPAGGRASCHWSVRSALRALSQPWRCSGSTRRSRSA